MQERSQICGRAAERRKSVIRGGAYFLTFEPKVNLPSPKAKRALIKELPAHSPELHGVEVTILFATLIRILEDCERFIFRPQIQHLPKLDPNCNGHEKNDRTIAGGKCMP